MLSNTILPVLTYIFASCNGDNRPYLEVDIFGIHMHGLLDSGANNTIIGNQGWAVLKNIGLTLLPSNIKTCSVANNTQCSVLGTVNIPFKLENKVKLLSVLVIPDVPHYLILGMDFWLAMEIIPHFTHNCWSFSDTCPPVPSVNSVQSLNNLETEQTRQLDQLLDKYFNLMGDKLGCTQLVEHKIITDSEPVKQRAYRVSPFVQEKIDKEVKYMLENDIIEPSSSAWSSPVVMVQKKDSSYRFCVDYRRLNRVTKKDAYPIPYIATILDRLRQAKYLSSLDIKSAYWQVPMSVESREYTAFTIPGRGLYQFKRMPFGLSNSPATWQRLVDRLLGEELEPNAFVYLDDIIVISDNFEKHMEILEKIFSRIVSAGLTLAREKCKFCLPELKYLGYVVNSKGLLVDPDKVKAILDIPSPKNVTEVRRVIGISSWYRRFLPAFSTIIAPMTELLHKNKKWNWSDDCEKSFQFIKDALVSAPILSCPDFSQPFVVQTDASAYGVGAVLSQKLDDGEHVICYISRSLSRAERNYSTTERECLAVLFAIEKLRPYLEGYKFIVVTDHHSLVWLHNLKEPTGRLARWALRLQQYDFEIIHRKGKEHVVPDLLSRAVPEINTLTIKNQNSSLPISSDNKWFHKMINSVNKSPLKYPQWRVENGKLFKYVSDRYVNLRDENELWKEVVPKESRKSVISKYHDSTISCHAGIHRTYQRIKNLYFWPKMLCDITRYVRSCPICLAYKPVQSAPAGQLGKTCTASKPWQTISIDLVGPLPRSTQGFRFILSIVDTFSKYTLFIPLRSATASAVTEKIEEHVFLVYGVPRTLLCDNGVQFRSHLFSKLCENYIVKIFYSPLYHAQSNPVERYNRSMKTMLSCFVKDNHKTWSKLLPKINCAVRTLANETTGLTPFFINFGREHIISGEDHTRPNMGQNQNRDYNSQAKEFESLFEDVKKRLERAHERSKPRYNLRHRPVQFTVGAKVYRRNYVISSAAQDFNAKLAPHYCGPFIIKKKLGSVTYQLVDENNRDKGIWHVKDLKAHPPDDLNFN